MRIWATVEVVSIDFCELMKRPAYVEMSFDRFFLVSCDVM